MPISVTIPTLGKPKNVKDAIISILTNEWPLSTRKIYNRVKNMGLDVSYQAVHKSISELVSENVLQRTEKSYKINYEWISKLRDFSLSLDYKYSDIPVGDNMIFNSLKDMDFFIMNVIKKITKSGKMEINCSHWTYTWWPLFASREEYSILRKIPNPKKIYITCRNNEAVAQWCKNIYQKIGINIKTGVMIEDNFDFMVYEHMVIQMYWPENLRKRMKKAFSVENINEIDVENVFTNIFEKETRINVIVIKNREIADQFREKVLEHFCVISKGEQSANKHNNSQY